MAPWPAAGTPPRCRRWRRAGPGAAATAQARARSTEAQARLAESARASDPHGHCAVDARDGVCARSPARCGGGRAGGRVPRLAGAGRDPGLPSKGRRIRDSGRGCGAQEPWPGALPRRAYAIVLQVVGGAGFRWASVGVWGGGVWAGVCGRLRLGG